MNESPVVFSPDAKQLIEDLAFCLDVKISFFSEDMYEYLVGYHTRSSDFCTMLQRSLQVRYRCLHQDNLMCEKCRQSGKKQIYSCHAGLTEVIIPIHIESSRLIYMVFGQFRMNDSLPEALAEEWKSAGFEEAQLESAFLDRPLLSEEKLQKMISIFEQNMTYLLTSGKIAIRRPALVESIQLYIDQHISEDIVIGEVAEAVFRSESAVSHAVKRELGISFKQLLTERRISAFEQLIISNPSLSIKECCRMVGYEDSLYFSRVFRKKTGMPPSDFVRKFRKPAELPAISIYNL